MEIFVDSTYYELIKSGKKIVEGRCATEKYKNIQPGDKISFLRADNTDSSTEDESFKVHAEVRKVTWYASFEDMLVNEGLQHCLPGIDTISKGCEIYRGFPNYAKLEKELGVIAIQFDLV
jgi:ASC-1-like (ASCH) protein